MDNNKKYGTFYVIDSYSCEVLYTKNPLTGTLTNIEDPNEMQHSAPFANIKTTSMDRKCYE